MSTLALKVKSKISLPLLDQAIVSGNNFLQGVLLARALGATVFGAWAAGQLALLLFLSLNQAYITTPMLTFIGKKEEKTHADYLQNLALIQILVAILGGVAGAVAAFFMFDPTNVTPLQFGLAVLVFLLWDFSRRQLLSLGAIKMALQLDFMLFLVQTGGFLALIFIKYISLPMAWMLWTSSLALANLAFWSFRVTTRSSNLLCHAVSICSSLTRKIKSNSKFPSLGWGRCLQHDTIGYLVMENKASSNPSPIQNIALEHWRDGRWLLVTALLQWFAGNYFIASSAMWIGQTALGTARMAQNIVGVLNIVLISLENTWPVAAAKAFKTNAWSGMITVLKQGMKRSTPMVLTFLGAFGVLGTVLFQLLFGHVPEGTSLVIWGYVSVYVLTFFALPLRVALRTVGKSRIIFISYLVSAVFALVFAPLFLQNWGLLGMVIGMVICQVLQMCVCLLGIKSIL
jgi:O-antigen/teichoic acid export membrane protein